MDILAPLTAALNFFASLFTFRNAIDAKTKEDQQRFGEAISKFQNALRETKLHLTGTYPVTDPQRSQELARLWADTAVALIPFHPDLGALAQLKAFSWSDLSVWSEADRHDANQQLAIVESQFLQLYRSYSDPGFLRDLSGRLTFSSVNQHYSMDKHDCPDIETSPNQCAVRLSRALIAAGMALDSDYKNRKCRHGFARGAQDLGAFLRIKWGVQDLGFEAPGTKPMQLNNTKGVILFANIPGFPGQGHIDLWDGSDIRTPDAISWNANPIWFWKLP